MTHLRIFKPKDDDILLAAVESAQDAGVNPCGLELEEVPLEGPWSPNPVVDRHLAKRRREQVRELLEARRRLCLPWCGSVVAGHFP